MNYEGSVWAVSLVGDLRNLYRTSAGEPVWNKPILRNCISLEQCYLKEVKYAAVHEFVWLLIGNSVRLW